MGSFGTFDFGTFDFSGGVKSFVQNRARKRQEDRQGKLDAKKQTLDGILEASRKKKELRDIESHNIKVKTYNAKVKADGEDLKAKLKTDGLEQDAKLKSARQKHMLGYTAARKKYADGYSKNPKVNKLRFDSLMKNYKELTEQDVVGGYYDNLDEVGSEFASEASANKKALVNITNKEDDTFTKGRVEGLRENVNVVQKRVSEGYTAHKNDLRILKILEDPEIETGFLQDIKNSVSAMLQKMSGVRSTKTARVALGLEAQKLLKGTALEKLQLMSGPDSDKDVQNILSTSPLITDPKELIQKMVGIRVTRYKLAERAVELANGFSDSKTGLKFQSKVFGRLQKLPMIGKVKLRGADGKIQEVNMSLLDALDARISKLDPDHTDEERLKAITDLMKAWK